MSRASKITRIFIHCSAGFGDIESQKAYWRSLGWKSVGYHIEVDLDGNLHQLANFEEVVNGVKYYNSTGIHICYTGGVDRNNYKIAKDTRTEEQKQGILNAISMALDWLLYNNIDLCNIKILGHRDISPDKNLNGRVDSWERIKECPSFDAIPEYSQVIDNYLLNLPLNYRNEN